MELTRRIAQDLGGEYEIKSMRPDALLAALNDETIDAVIAPLAVTEELKSSYDVSREYYSDSAGSYGVILRKDSGLLIKINALLSEYDASGVLAGLGQTWALRSDYLLPDSNSAYLTTEDLKGLSQKEYCLARNEIYARHNRIFSTAEIAAYFETKAWYTGLVSPESFNNEVLNAYEKSNVALIMKYEKDTWGGSYY